MQLFSSDRCCSWASPSSPESSTQLMKLPASENRRNCGQWVAPSIRRILLSSSDNSCSFAQCSRPWQQTQNFMCRSPVAVAQSTSCGVAICYVLPVLWMTSRLVVIGHMAIVVLQYCGGVWCLWMPCLNLVVILTANRCTGASVRSISRHMAPVDAHNSAISRAIPQKWEKTCLRCGRTAVWNFTPIGKAPAEKSVTVHNEWKKPAANLVSRPYHGGIKIKIANLYDTKLPFNVYFHWPGFTAVQPTSDIK